MKLRDPLGLMFLGHVMILTFSCEGHPPFPENPSPPKLAYLAEYGDRFYCVEIHMCGTDEVYETAYVTNYVSSQIF